MSAWADTLIQLPQRALTLLVRGYRLLLKPWLGNACRFEPTCSQYALDALQRHGALRGSLLAGGRILRCHPRDPSWFQWPLLEAAIEGNIVADFPLCNKSFNCSYSGVDL